MVAPNLLLLFLPIPHTNFLTWLTGVSCNRLIRFHRWVLGLGGLVGSPGIQLPAGSVGVRVPKGCADAEQ